MHDMRGKQLRLSVFDEPCTRNHLRTFPVLVSKSNGENRKNNCVEAQIKENGFCDDARTHSSRTRMLPPAWGYKRDGKRIRLDMEFRLCRPSRSFP